MSLSILFAKIDDRLKTNAPTIQTRQLWNNQLENGKQEEARAYPITYTELSVMSWESQAKGVQKGDIMVSVRVVLERYQTDDRTFLAIVEEVYKALNGFSSDEFTPLTRIASVQDSDHDNLIVWQIDFQTLLIDCTSFTEREGTSTTIQPLLIRPDGLEIPMPPPVCKVARITDSDGVTVFEVDSGGTGACSVLSTINISNSNDSYSVDTLVDLELPNIDFTDSDGVTTSVPSMEDLVCTPLPTPVGWLYNRDYFTLQSTSYKTYDDAWQWLTGTNMNFTDPTNPATFATLDLATDSTGMTMLDDNEFGNKLRRTDISGNAVVAVNGQYVIDHYYGIGFWDGSYIGTYNSATGVGGLLETFNTALTGGFNDFFMVNRKIVDIVTTMNTSNVWTLPYLSTSTFNILTSTTVPLSTGNVYRERSTGDIPLRSKGSADNLLYCRVHYK